MTNESPEELRRLAAEYTARADQLGASQLTQADLETMHWRDIEKAREDGRLQVLFGAPSAEAELTQRAKAGRISLDEIPELMKLRRHDLVDAARESGRIDGYPTTEGNQA